MRVSCNEWFVVCRCSRSVRLFLSLVACHACDLVSVSRSSSPVKSIKFAEEWAVPDPGRNLRVGGVTRASTPGNDRNRERSTPTTNTPRSRKSAVRSQGNRLAPDTCIPEFSHFIKYSAILPHTPWDSSFTLSYTYIARSYVFYRSTYLSARRVHHFPLLSIAIRFMVLISLITLVVPLTLSG